METCPFYWVDAFTSGPFTGNPAAVVLVKPGWTPSESVMLQLANELHLSETAFIEVMDGEVAEDPFRELSHFRLRWFTPTVEIGLCGHGTLGTAAALLFEVGNTNDSLRFETKSGELVVSRTRGGALGTRGVCMDFPANPPLAPHPFRELPGCLQQVVTCLIGRVVPVQEVAYSPTTKKLIVRLVDGTHYDTLATMRPDTDAAYAVDQSSAEESGDFGRVTGVSVAIWAPAGAPRHMDFVTRYFAPWNGIAEDPVNGSSHTVLTPYFASRERGEEEEVEFIAGMASARTGALVVGMRRGGDRVSLAGEAVTVLRGSVDVPVSP